MKWISIVIVSLFLYGAKVSFFKPSVISQSTQYYEENDIHDGESDIYYVKKYGVPVHEFIKPRYEFSGEYYIGLNQTYRITNPEVKDVPIKEILWQVRNDLNLTCWFHYKDGQWKVISYIFWPPGAVF
ncbi:hypothetical protein [Enterobacter sp.]|uniref:hypothetical protein n=1 Tax=Enterobacter sp. TaxID=42895 RepID=UPI00296FA4CF|nr:hypothetical protein [Enterobacter sp.]